MYFEEKELGISPKKTLNQPRVFTSERKNTQTYSFLRPHHMFFFSFSQVITLYDQITSLDKLKLCSKREQCRFLPSLVTVNLLPIPVQTQIYLASFFCFLFLISQSNNAFPLEHEHWTVFTGKGWSSFLLPEQLINLFLAKDRTYLTPIFYCK